MLKNISALNIVRAGSDITYSSLKEIGNRILDSFRGTIKEFKLARLETPNLSSIVPIY